MNTNSKVVQPKPPIRAFFIYSLLNIFPCVYFLYVDYLEMVNPSAEGIRAVGYFLLFIIYIPFYLFFIFRQISLGRTLFRQGYKKFAFFGFCLILLNPIATSLLFQVFRSFVFTLFGAINFDISSIFWEHYSIFSFIFKIALTLIFSIVFVVSYFYTHKNHFKKFS